MNLNENSARILEDLEKIPGIIEKKITLGSKTAMVLDIGVNARLNEEDSMNAALATAKASTGCLAEITTRDGKIHVSILENVALATLGCQMAGWAIPIEGVNAMASGPARVLARKPKSFFSKIEYEEKSDKTVVILESDRIPNKEACSLILEKTGAREALIVAFKGDSKIGLINVLARVVELAVYRLNHLGYDVNKIISAAGEVEIPKTLDMCNANDQLIYNSTVSLKVENWDENLLDKCTSKSSACYGKKFKEIYEKASCNFYNIDESIFAPAEVIIKDVKTATTYTAGCCLNEY